MWFRAYDMSQGIVVTGFKSGEIYDYDFIANLLLSVLWNNS